MSLSTAPSLSSLPSLSVGGASDGSSVGTSNLSSALCTPDDTSIQDYFTERTLTKNFGQRTVPQVVDDGSQFDGMDDADVPKPRTSSISRAMSRAKKLAGMTLRMRKSLRREEIPAVIRLDDSTIYADTHNDPTEDCATISPSRLSIMVTQDTISDTSDDYDPLDQSSTIGQLGSPVVLMSPAMSVEDQISNPKVNNSPEAEVLLDEDMDDESQCFRTHSLQMDDDDVGLLSYHVDDSYAGSISLSGSWTINAVVILLSQVVLFLPWCIGVGGTILFSPAHLSIVASGSGHMLSEKGSRRFAYWAHCAEAHIVIFLGFVGSLVYLNPYAGTALIAAGLARFVYVWHDFQVDLSVPLGVDDQQSVYLVVTKMYLQDGVALRILD
ncbi:uncharacterized protein FIBRA_03746 [Fibroporia radiculosa]|uniref:Uncharacterized protein n=1 Tax=Fibroporia radiculosa TaxID=599839 RepID=J4HW57_9APHY|nr:uncharacterized protein FIBRA_03746 [Fibroporia radiculosa]CCM01682.1 predicted protein [Fibroporia radiculosa]